MPVTRLSHHLSLLVRSPSFVSIDTCLLRTIVGLSKEMFVVDANE